jgi:nucleoside-diphosphate-sugar epimerase
VWRANVISQPSTSPSLSRRDYIGMRSLAAVALFYSRTHKGGLQPCKLILDEDPFIKPWMIDFADDHYALDVSRARTPLGWYPKHSLREALPESSTVSKPTPRAGIARTN